MTTPHSDHTCLSNGTPGAFTPPRQFDEDGKPFPCCGDGLGAGPFGAKQRRGTDEFGVGPDHFVLIDNDPVCRAKVNGWRCERCSPTSAPVPDDLDTDGYGWPPLPELPWGETEKIIDQMLDGENPVLTIGNPFDYPQPGPRGLVYLAGPMRGIEDFNFPAFHAADAHLTEEGWGVFNPARMDEMNGHDFMGTTGHEDTSALGFNLREALGNDLAFITDRADAVAVLPGWEKSMGARAEVSTALALGIPVFHALEGPAHQVTEVPGVTNTLVVNGVRWTDVEDLGDGQFDLKGNVELPKIELDFERGDIRPEVLAVLMGETFPTADQLPGDGWTFAPNADGEVRTVSSTGGEKGKKPEQYDQIPVNALAELARHFGYGANKYSAHNFRKGYDWSLCFNALMRHALLFWSGEDYDEHKPDCAPDCVDHLPMSKHIIAVAWHALALSTFMDEHPEFDDRYKTEV